MSTSTSRFYRLDEARYRLPQEWTQRVLSPALVIYLEPVRENLARMLALMGGDVGRWRPHIKTTKLRDVYVEMLRVGLRRFKCATLREALTMLEAFESEGRADADLLLVYPLVGPALDQLGRLARRFPAATLSVLCEDPAAVAHVDPQLGIFVDVDPGMRRTGIPLEDRETIHHVARSAGGRFRGVHFYDGHIQGSSAAQRREMAHNGYAQLLELLVELRAVAPIEELVTSGTPAFRYALDYEPFAALGETVHRVSPGTVVLHDLRSEQDLEDLELVPAAAVLTRVVSHPGVGRVTCDAGSKSIAAEAGDPCALALGWPGLEALTPSEEHLPFAVHSGARPDRGQLLYVVPRHVCPTVNLAEQALIVDGETIRVRSVHARAHDLLLDGPSG